MKKFLIGSALVATLTLSGLSARASCVDPRSSSQETPALDLKLGSMPAHSGQEVGEKIVGTWYVAYTTEGAPPGRPSSSGTVTARNGKTSIIRYWVEISAWVRGR